MSALARAVMGPLGWRVAALTLALGAAVEVVWVGRGIDEWRSAQLTAVIRHAAASGLLAPLAAALAAVEIGAVRWSALGTVADVHRRTSRMILAAGLRAGGLLAALHLVGMVVAILVTRSHGLTGSPPVSAELPALLALPACALLGAAVAWRVRSVAVPPLVAAVVFVVLVNGSEFPSQVLNLGTSGDYVGFTAVGWWVVAASVTLVLLGLAAVAAVSRRGRPLAAVALAGVVVLLVAGPTRTVREQRDALVCGGSAPAVCAFPERAGFITKTRSALVELQARLEAVGIPPERWPQRYAERAGAGAIGTTVDPEDHQGLVLSVMESATRCEPEDSVEGDVPYLDLWLTREMYGTEDEGAAAVEGPPGFTAQPRVERKALAAAKRLGGQRCA